MRVAASTPRKLWQPPRRPHLPTASQGVRRATPDVVVSFLSLVAVLSLLIGPSWQLHAQPSGAESSTQTEGPTTLAAPPTVTIENPERGVYRVHLRGSVAASARPMMEFLLAYELRCESGCPYAVPAITRSEIIEQQGEPQVLEPPFEMRVWTFVDDVLDASYFTSVVASQDGASSTLRFGTPEADELERLDSDRYPHDPFFHQVHGSWRLTEVSADDPTGPRTEVEMRMEMLSDRFLVNLFPQRVLDGSRTHALTIFAHLRDLGAPSTP